MGVCAGVEGRCTSTSLALTDRNLPLAEGILFAPFREDDGYSYGHEYHPECREALDGVQQALELLLREFGETRSWFYPELALCSPSEQISLATMKMLRERKGMFIG